MNNNNNYNKNKMIFTKLINDKYKIREDLSDKNILLITSVNKKIKCKYSLLFIEKIINEHTSLIIWSDANPYIDKYTQGLTNALRLKLLNTHQYLLSQNSQLITKSDLTNLIQTLIKTQYSFTYNNKSINCEWILTNNNTDGTNEYYLILNIIYF
ncbi:MAG: hypothetical protein Gaeavirus32_4 [Gaeavirus sp.]|uniref:Uncharacterized protein n=1 Tax=Gaeavirus sp. TaxID=2487767 RepID=A0A3G4ZZD4_9VIRU|nr:MAG: hypothetical protein Gaeavirus32_4 [Gaeavirus sp.]